MRVAVLGAPGQLGSDLITALEAADHQPHALGHDAVEVAELDSVQQALDRIKPQLVINAAAFHRVDECEDRPWEAFRVNAVGAWNVAKCAARLEAGVVYVSTDYVFSGPSDRPWLEDDLPEPGNLYGVSKLAGEACTRAANPRAMVVRTSGLFGLHPCRVKGLNFVDLMLKLAADKGRVMVVSDEELSPTYTKDLSRAMVALAESERPGLYHLANQGAVSWYDFAAATFEESGTSCELLQAPPGAFPKKAPRPANSSLASKRLAEAGVEPLRGWREALRDYLQDRGRTGSAT